MNPDTEHPPDSSPVESTETGREHIPSRWDAICKALESPANRFQYFSGFLVLLALVFVVYLPILPGVFLMDDLRLIETDNALVSGQFTPFNIWFQTDFTLSTFALWLQHLAWTHHPGWYHAVNLLLHASSAMLVWRLLAKLKVPAAWIIAALYAVHPVCVVSVARIAEIKNTLSLPFFLLSIWAYLHYETLALYPDPKAPNANRSLWRPATFWYSLALVAFVAALLSKTSTVMLPFLLIACAAWRRNRVGRLDWLHTAPFFVLSLAFGLMSIWFQKNQALADTGQILPAESFGERLAIAGHVFWFYLGKTILPFNLNLIYPQWKLDPASIIAYLPLALFVAGLGVCWYFRHIWGRAALFALGCFAIALFPALGFFDSQFLISWQVSDHLQYLPLIAPVALAVAALCTWSSKDTFRITTAVVLLIFAAMTFQRASVFASEEKLMRDTIFKNPAAGMAHNDLGVILAKRNDLGGAMQQFKMATDLQPDNFKARSNLGQTLAYGGKLDEAESQYQSVLKLMPFDADTHKRYAELLRHKQRNREALFHYQVALAFKPDNQTRLAYAAFCYQIGDGQEAIAQFHKALQIEPNNAETLNNLAWLLATWDDEHFRNGMESVSLAEKACSLTDYKLPRMTGTLAAAYAEAGRFPDAIKTGELTVKLANDATNQNLANFGSQLLNLYRENKPYHQPIPAGAK